MRTYGISALCMCVSDNVTDFISLTGKTQLMVLLWPLQHGETWNSNNCTKEMCDDGRVITEPLCKPVTVPVCDNGHPPVRVYDEKGCCFHYECRCKFK